MQGWLQICKSVNQVHHINRFKDTSYYCPIDVKRLLTKFDIYDKSPEGRPGDMPQWLRVLVTLSEDQG